MVLEEKSDLIQEPRKLKKGFLVLEGDIVTKDASFLTEDGCDFDELFYEEYAHKINKNRLKNIDDIKNGDIVYSYFYGEDIVPMEIFNLNLEQKSAKGKLNEYLWADLSFNIDFRECWVCTGYILINVDAISKVELET